MPRDIRTRVRSADTKRAGSGARAENRASRNIWKSNQSQSGRRPSAQIPGPARMPLVSLEFLTKSLENFHNLSRALSPSTGTGGGFSGGGGGSSRAGECFFLAEQLDKSRWRWRGGSVTRIHD